MISNPGSGATSTIELNNDDAVNTVVTISLSFTTLASGNFSNEYSLTINRLPPPPPAPTEGKLLVDSSLVPPGLEVGSQIRLLFVGGSITPVSADYGDYNDIVAAEAVMGHSQLGSFSSQFRALVSTHEVDARDNTATRSGNVPIYWAGGDKVADNYADFYNGSWDSRIPRNSAGEEINANTIVLTGSLANGIGQPRTRIGDSSQGFRVGQLSQGEGNEIDADVRTDNGAFRPLYGLSPVLNLLAAGARSPTVENPIPDQEATVRVFYEYTIPANTFEDLNANEELTYTVSGRPAWLAFNPVTRTLSGTASSADFTPVNPVAPTQFTITVTASDNNSASADTDDPFTLNLNAGAPLAPANVSATSGDGIITVSWDPVTDGGGYPVRAYEARINYQNPTNPSETLVAECSAIPGTECTLTGLTNGRSYFGLQVTAYSGPMTLPTVSDHPFSSTTDLGESFVVIPVATIDSGGFVTVWRTTANDESIIIPTNSNFTYNYTVDWGDGTDPITYTGNASHTYADADDYVVTITGNFPQIYFNNTSAHQTKIRNISRWGNQVWASMQNSFYGATNLTILGDAGSPDLSVVTNTSQMFRGATLVNHLGGDWDVGTVTDMSSMFNGATSFNADVSEWDVSNVINMSGVFNRASAFNADISAWVVSGVTEMNSMFNGASVFNADISKWDVSGVTNMNNMLNGASAFDQNLGAWDVGAVTAAGNMLLGVTLSRENYDALLAGWSKLSGLTMGLSFHAGGSQFCDAFARHGLTAANGWTITDGGRATNCPLVADAFITTWAVAAMQNLIIPTNNNFTYDYIVDWGDDSITGDHMGDADHTYTDAGTYTVTIIGDFPQLAVGSNTASRTAIRSVEQWGDQVWGSMQNNFAGAANLVFSPGAGQPDLSNVTSMRSMFQGARNFNSPIGDWNVSNVTDMAHMFQNARLFNQDLSAWDVSNVTDMSRMFNQANKFDQNLGAWDVSGVTATPDAGLTGMFQLVTLSRENYDSLLAGWSEIDTDAGEKPLQSGLNFGAGNSKYCNQAARDILTNPPNSWTITGDGFDGDSNCTLRFEDGVSIADQSYSVDTAITLSLPRATGGIAPLTYTLDPDPPASGLTFIAPTADAPGQLIGRPSEIMSARDVIYTVTDNGGQTVTLTFRITVNPIAKLSLGATDTDPSINLNLIFPIITANGKIYYHLDRNDDGSIDNADRFNHQTFDNILNDGDDTVVTQVGMPHNGSDDERSVRVGDYTLILPTVAEWRTFRNNNNLPAGWQSGFYLSADIYQSRRTLNFISNSHEKIKLKLWDPLEYKTNRTTLEVFSLPSR